MQYWRLFLVGAWTAKTLNGFSLEQTPEQANIAAAAAVAAYLFTGQLSGSATEILIPLASAAILVIATIPGIVRSVLITRTSAFLGRISCSLYLSLATVLFVLVHAIPGRVSAPGALLLYFPAALLIAYCFCALVEGPWLHLERS